MHTNQKKLQRFSAVLRLSAVFIVVVVLAVGAAAAQDSPVTTPIAPDTSAIQLGGFSAGTSFSATSTTTRAESRPRVSDTVRSDRVRRITLEQVKRAVDPAVGPLARLGQLSIEAAKQHRLGVQADYFPKFGATFVNLHFTEFLGQVLAIRRPLQGGLLQVPIPLISQNQTIAALTFVQPITPLFQVRQVVRIARADERIARAKAGVSVTKNARDAEIEETYFKLLIAQRKLTSFEFKLRSPENRPLYAAASSEVMGASRQGPELAQADMAVTKVAAEVRQLTASLNRLIGWPEDTELELARPDPLEENITLEEVAANSSAANPDVIEAEQTVVKARAASVLSKLEYVPTVAAVSGYMFQNAIPSVPSHFGYGGVMASYTLFDFGKRESAVKEARAKLGMAEVALQLTKAKVAANIKKSYSELERSRQLSQLAQKVGSSAAFLMNVSSSGDSMEVKAARAEVEVEMLEADLAHRQAFARLKTLMGSER